MLPSLTLDNLQIMQTRHKSFKARGGEEGGGEVDVTMFADTPPPFSPFPFSSLIDVEIWGFPTLFRVYITVKGATNHVQGTPPPQKNIIFFLPKITNPPQISKNFFNKPIRYVNMLSNPRPNF